MTSKTLFKRALPALFGLALFAFRASAAPPPAGLDAVLPAEVLGWKPAGPDQTFDPSNLARYMAGGEGLYLAYDFRKLTTREYARPAYPRLTAEVFEMGSPEEAFGLFSNEREASPADFGNGGLAGTRFIQFWKGSVFVRIVTEREMAETRKALTTLAQTIATALPPGGRKPLLVSCLPVQDLLPGRVSYFHLQSTIERFKFPGDPSVLALGRETDGVLAEYRRGGKTLAVLICRYPSQDGAGRVFDAVLRAYFGLKGASAGEVVTRKLAPERFATARLADRAVILVFDAPGKGEARTLSDQVFARTKDVLGS